MVNEVGGINIRDNVENWLMKNSYSYSRVERSKNMRRRRIKGSCN